MGHDPAVLTVRQFQPHSGAWGPGRGFGGVVVGICPTMGTVCQEVPVTSCGGQHARAGKGPLPVPVAL